MSERLVPRERRKQILEAAVKLAKEGGYHALTRDKVAEAAGVSFGLVTHYFGSVCSLLHEVMKEAIAREIPEIVAAGLASGDPLAKSAPQELKEKAAAIISSV